MRCGASTPRLPLTSPPAETPFSCSSRQHVAARARAPLAVSANAEKKWKVVKPEQVNVRCPPAVPRNRRAHSPGSACGATWRGCLAALRHGCLCGAVSHAIRCLRLVSEPAAPGLSPGAGQRQGLHLPGHPHRGGVPHRQRPALVRPALPPFVGGGAPSLPFPPSHPPPDPSIPAPAGCTCLLRRRWRGGR